MSDVPAWIEDRVALCRDALGCHDIEIGMEMADAPGGEAHNGAVVYRYYDTLSARIVCRRNLEDNELGRKVITHEMLHVALMHLVDHVELIIEMLPEERHDYANELLRRGLEPNVERMSRALTWFLDGWKKPEEGEYDGPSSV